MKHSLVIEMTAKRIKTDVRSPFANWIAIVISAVGVVLLIVTMLARVNPAEGSVVRPEFLQTPLGKPIAMLLLIASMPGWAGTLLSAHLGASFRAQLSVCIELFLFQAAGYWVLGKLISIGWRKWWSREHQTAAQGDEQQRNAMKINKDFTRLFTTVLIAGMMSVGGWAAETNAVSERIGIYDSRVIAYAHFWTDTHQKQLNELIKTARETKAAGQTNRYHELAAQLNRAQEQNHLRVFSTAPVDDVLAEMKEQVAVVEKEAGVSRLVSKWDDKALAPYKPANRVDVTDALLRDFKLTDQQKKVIADMRKQKPIPLDKAKELLREGKL
jgi:hypothetical protein